MRSALFWMSLPLLLPQALRLRKTAPRFAAASGPNAGCAGHGRPLSLLVFGDSIAAGVGATTYEKALVGHTAIALANSASVSVHWQSVGYIGANSSLLLRNLDRMNPRNDVDFIVLSVGVNDVTSLTTLKNWRRNLALLLGRLNDLHAPTLIAVCGLPPFSKFPLLPQPLRTSMASRGAAIDDESRRVIANFPSAVHVPLLFDAQPEKFAADGYHPSELGYAEFGTVMGALLARYRQDRTPSHDR